MEASLLPRFDSSVRKDALRRKARSWEKECDAFMQRVEACTAGMEKSLRAGALGNWLARTHELRLAATHIGARKLAGFCDEAEQVRSLRDGQAQALLYHIEKEIACLRGVLV